MVICFVSECPSFLNTLPKGPGNLCFVHQSCNKISCAVQLLYANQRTMATFDIKMDNCLKQINVSTQSTTTVLEFQNGLLLFCHLLWVNYWFILKCFALSWLHSNRLRRTINLWRVNKWISFLYVKFYN